MKKTTIATLKTNINVNKFMDYADILRHDVFKNEFSHTPVYSIDDIVANNIHVALAKHVLLGLYSKGNMSAYDTMCGHVGVIDLDDLAQECLLGMLEVKDRLIDSKHGSIRFEDKDVCLAVLGSVSRYLYRHAVRHYKHMYIELDGDIVRYDNVQALSTHANIDDIIESDYMSSFMALLTDTEKRFLIARLQGVSTRNSADVIGVSYKAVRTIEKHVRDKWASFHK